MNGKPLTDEEGEVRELTAQDLRSMKPAAEVLPAELSAVLMPERRATQEPGPSSPITATFDPEADAAYICLSSEKFARTQQVSDCILFDFDADGRLIGIEVLDARRLLSADLLESLPAPPAPGEWRIRVALAGRHRISRQVRRAEGQQSRRRQSG